MKGLKFNKLSTTNAFTFKKLDLDLKDQGLVFLRGRNFDISEENPGSNGSGKSAICDVIEHVLFGTTSRGTSKDDIVRAGSKSGYTGDLSFSFHEDEYEVQQSRKHKTRGSSVHVFKTINNKQEEITHLKDIRKSQSFVHEDLLKMTLQQFHGSVYLSQEAAHPLISGSGPEITKYLSSVFGFEVYDELKEKIKEQMDQTQQKVAAADVYLKAIQDTSKELENYPDPLYIIDMAANIKKYLGLAQLRSQRLQRLDTKLAELYGLARQKSNLQGRRLMPSLSKNQITKEADVVTKDLLLVDKKLIQTISVLKNIEKQKQQQQTINTLTDQVNSEQERLDLQDKDVESMKSLLAVVEDKADKYQKLLTNIVSLSGFDFDDNVTSSDAKAQMVEAQEKIQEHTALVEDLLPQTSILKTKLLGSNCPTCGQEIKDAAHLAKERAKAEKIQAQIETIRNSKKVKQNELSDIEDQYKILLQLENVLSVCKTLGTPAKFSTLTKIVQQNTKLFSAQKVSYKKLLVDMEKL